MKTATAIASHTARTLRSSLPSDPHAWSQELSARLTDRLPSPLRVLAGPAGAAVQTVLPLAARAADVVLGRVPGAARSGDTSGARSDADSGEAGERRHYSQAAADVGAPGVATARAEDVAESVMPDGDEPDDSSELPVPEWDTLALGTLRARTARLSAADLAVLLEWERAHAHRLQVITMLENRLARHADGDAGR